MKLKFQNIEQEFDYAENNVCELVLENPEMFFTITNGLIKQVNGEEQMCFLYEKDKDFDLNKYAEIVSDFYSFSCNSKKINLLVQKKILQICENVDFAVELDNLNKTLQKVMNKIGDNVDISINMNKEIQFPEVVKFMDIEVRESSSLFERLIDYVNLLGKLKGIKLLVLLNLSAYLSAEKIKLIFKQCAYNEIKVLLICNADKGLPVDKKVIIDKALCEI